MHTPWVVSTGGVAGAASTLPPTECSNCKGTSLGFEVNSIVAGPRKGQVQFYQGCNDCSETLWTGDWDTFHAILALLYDIRIPRCD
jgi:hypothetical protein